MDRITELSNEIVSLRQLLRQKEEELCELKKTYQNTSPQEVSNQDSQQKGVKLGQLPRWAIERYSRQILLPDIGVRGQERLCGSRVLVVGAGGLGCPAAALLAGAGVGTVGVLDHDTVDVTNLHRQPLHSEDAAGTAKCESAARALRRLNSNVRVRTYNCQIDSKNALDIISEYDVVLDCTDNMPTRYLLNDAAVMAKVPVISGSALKMEGQLTIYNFRDENHGKECTESGPCYRCVFPAPPPPEVVGSCSSDGVCGPVPHVIGSLQALEAIKLLVGMRRDKLLVSRLLVFDGDDLTFRVVRLRSRNPQCPVCGDTPTVTSLVDYEIFCKTKAIEKDLDLKILGDENRITAKQLAEKLEMTNAGVQRHLLVDVRSDAEFRMCSIDGATNYPIDNINAEAKFQRLLEDIRNVDGEVTFLCRRGNDSQILASRVLQHLPADVRIKVKDLVGGLHSWAKNVDSNFPVY